MKIRITRLLLAISFLGFLSCQQEDRSTSSSSESIPLALRLVAASGNPIPEADTLRFVVTVGSKTTDTLVDWDQHELDLGSVKEGDEIQWQAMAWKWDSSKTVRRVVWASKKLAATARSSGNSQAFTLETPVETSTFEAPELVPEGFAIGNADSVSLADKDSAFKFTFKVSAGVDTVRIDDTLAKAEDGVYSKTYTVAPGKSLLVKVWIKDTLGSISVLKYTLSRGTSASPVQTDSSVTVRFLSPPEDTSYANRDSIISVEVRTISKLQVQSVMVGKDSLKPRSTNSDTIVWAGMVGGLVVGTNTLEAYAAAGNKNGSDVCSVTRRTVGEIDSSIDVSFMKPSPDTIIANADSSLPVTVRASSELGVDSVKVGTIRLDPTDSTKTFWIGTINGINVGTDSLKAVAYAKSKTDSARLKLTRKAIDSSIKISFLPSSSDTNLANRDSSVFVKVQTISKLLVQSVMVGKDSLKSQTSNSDTIVWEGTIGGLEVGPNTLNAIAFAGNKKDSAIRKVTRLPVGVIDSTIYMFFTKPPRDTVLANSDSSLTVTIQASSKLGVDSVVVGKVSLTASDSNKIWTGTIRDIAVGTDSLKAIAYAKAKKCTVGIEVVRRAKVAVDSTISVKFRTATAKNIRFVDSILQVEVEVLSKLAVVSVLVGKDTLTHSGTNDTLWVGLVRGLKVGDNTLKAIATTSLRKDSASFVVTRAQDSTITTSFLEPSGDTILPTNATSLQVRLKVITKLPVASVVVVGKDSLKPSGGNDSVWSGTVKDLVEGANTLLFVVKAGAKKDTVRKTVNRAGDSTISVVFMDPKNDTTLSNSDSSLPVTVKVTTKLTVTSVKIDTVSLVRDGSTSDLWKTTLKDLIVGTDSLRAVATAGSKTGTGLRVVTRRSSVAAPSFTPPAGSYVGAQTVVLAASSEDSIEYSTDNTEWFSYSGPSVSVSTSRTLFARAYKDGSDTSYASATYAITTPPPSFGAASGTHLDSVRVAIKPGVTGAIRYWSNVRSNWIHLTGTDTVTLRKSDSLFAWDSLPGQSPSTVVAARYEVTATKPVINPRGGSFVSSKSVTITASTSGASIEWSTDKSTWKAFTIALDFDTNVTVWARTTKQGLTTSAMDSGVFKIAVNPPVFKKAGSVSTGGGFKEYTTVTMLSETIGSSVSWSTDSTIWKAYTTGIPLDTTTTFWAKATKLGMEPSAMVKVTFTDTAFGYKLKNSPRPSSGCGKSAITSGTYALSFAGYTRTYVIKFPTNYDKNKPYRLLFGMHSMSNSAEGIRTGNWYNLVQQDSANSTIWVAPQGASSGIWATNNDSDLVFFDTLLAKLKQNVCVDTSRVFVVGFSFGAMYAHSVARSRQRVLRGAVVYGTTEYNIYNPPAVRLPLPWMGMVGMKDGTTPIGGNNGSNGGRAASKRFVNYNGGDSSQTVAESDTVTANPHICSDYSGVNPRYPVKWCTFPNGHMPDPVDGTAASGGTNSWVPKESWEFIKQF